MKIRSDFVTNSSSSSFIIAVKKDVSEEEIDLYVNRVLPKVSSYFKSTNSKKISEEELSEARDGITKIINEAVRRGVDIDPWYVTSLIISSEDSDDIVNSFLYDKGLENTEWLKVGMGWD